jgi:hypothetical protein
LSTAKSRIGVFLTCWKWFSSVLKEADVQLEAHNQEKIDKVIHQYIGEQSSYGRCSADWKKASKEIKANPEMKKELISKLKATQ